VQDIIFVKDLQGRYTYLNPAGTALLERPLNQLVGQSDRALFGEAQASWIERDDQRVIEQGQALTQQELDVETPIGKRSFFTTKAPFLDLDGKVQGLIGVSRDITRRLQLEAEGEAVFRRLEESNQQLEARVEERTEDLSTFAYQVTHDLRSPLRSIEGFAKAVLEDYGGVIDATGRLYLERIVARASRMDQLILDLMAYTGSAAWSSSSSPWSSPTR